MRVVVFNAKTQLVGSKPMKAEDPGEHGRRAGVKRLESGKYLLTDNPSQNHYRSQDTAADQAERYGGRDDFKFVSVLCRLQSWEQQFTKIIFQHERLWLILNPLKPLFPSMSTHSPGNIY